MGKPDDQLRPSTDDAEHTPAGAPTDKAHEAVGDGTLQGSVPAGLTPEELLKIAESDATDDGGTG
ncbi:hypothetical protein [Sphingomonas sp. SRS2]|uniref:hypothetical protein n=1 Tax=Sphingomonas sp. SRS2 TaxID=133190 RepID=UPI0006183F2C|nr:hypothetical protein [Sphingomonas sp. SRS2]KKC24641.1 hypothetical protein WP12_18260 [Sphingomonas sp. SRS2]